MAKVGASITPAGPEKLTGAGAEKMPEEDEEDPYMYMLTFMSYV